MKNAFHSASFIGVACLTLALPLVLGFAIAGTVIGVAAKDDGIAPFLRLALSGLVLGILFLGIGVAISTFSRTRVQSLVAALLTWCIAVFVFDLVALGLLVSTKSPVATQEIEVLCDTTHVNAAADIHSTFDNVTGGHAPAEVLERVRFPLEHAQRHRRRPIHQSHQTHRRQAAHLPGRVSAKADGQHDCLVRWPHRRLKSAWWSKPL